MAQLFNPMAVLWGIGLSTVVLLAASCSEASQGARVNEEVIDALDGEDLGSGPDLLKLEDAAVETQGLCGTGDATWSGIWDMANGGPADAEVIAAFAVFFPPLVPFDLGFGRSYGFKAAYLYSDGRLLFRDSVSCACGPSCPFFWKAVPEGAWAAIRDSIDAEMLLGEAQAGSLAVSVATDQPVTRVYLKEGPDGLAVSIYGDLFDAVSLTDDPMSVAPAAASLAFGLEALAREGHAFVPSEVAITAVEFSASDGSESCGPSDAVPWPFVGLTVPVQEGGPLDPAKVMELSGADAESVRKWWVDLASEGPCLQVLVRDNARALQILLADLPPGGSAALPFPANLE